LTGEGHKEIISIYFAEVIGIWTRSTTNRLKSKGSRIDPWGTRDRTMQERDREGKRAIEQ